MPALSQGPWASTLARTKQSWGKIKTSTQPAPSPFLDSGKFSKSFPRLLLQVVVPVQLFLSSPAHSWGGGRGRELEC